MISGEKREHILLGGFVKARQEGSRVVLTAQNGRVAVSFLKPDMVRVRMAGAEKPFARRTPSPVQSKSRRRSMPQLRSRCARRINGWSCAPAL